MKKIIFTLVLTLCSAFLFAQNYAEISTSQLPKGATSYISKNFKGMSIIRAVKVNDNGVIKYGTVLDGKGRKYTLVFDKDGKFLDKGEDLLKKLQSAKTAQQAKPNTDPKAGSTPTGKQTTPAGKSTGQSGETAVPKK